MSIPPLSYLCLQQINKSDPTYHSSLVEELNELEQCAKEWKWIPIRGGDSDWINRFDFATASDEEFKALSGASRYYFKAYHYPIECQHFTTIQKMLDFLKERKVATSAMYSNSSTEFGMKNYISIYYDIPTDQQAKTSFKSCRLFRMRLPNRSIIDTVKVTFSDLSFINSFLKEKWTKKDIDKLKYFVIYYINQLAKDNINQDTNRLFYNPSTTLTDKRVSLAIQAKDQKGMINALFKNGERL